MNNCLKRKSKYQRVIFKNKFLEKNNAQFKVIRKVIVNFKIHQQALPIRKTPLVYYFTTINFKLHCLVCILKT